MRESDAFLATIVANPDEDTPRLVYADWLDENRPDKVPSPAAGPSARAEFIRVQCRLAGMTPADPEYTDLLDRQDDLAVWLTTHAPEKQKLPGGLQAVNDWYGDHSRGFPHLASKEHGARTVPKFCAAVEQAAATTTIRALRLYEFTPAQIAEFVRHPAAALLRELAAQPSADDGGFFDLDDDTAGWVPRPGAGEAEGIARAVTESPHVRNLRDLRLFFPLSDAAAGILARAKHLDNLTSFNAELGATSPAGLRTLARAGWFRNLCTLWFGERLRDDMLTALAGLPPFPNLRALHLTDNAFTAKGLARFAASKAFPNLVELDISRTPIGPAGAVALAKAKWRLAVLNLRACNIGSAGAEALARSRLLGGVRVSDLAANDLGFRGVKALAESPHAASLRHLDLGFNHPLRKSGLMAVAKSPHLRNLTRLLLHEHMGYAARYTAEDLTAFLGALDMPNLRELALDEMPLRASGVRAVAASPSFARVTRLNLAGDRIPDGGFRTLLESPHLRRLIDVNFANNRIGASAAALADRAVWPLLSRCNLNGNKIPRAAARKIVRTRRGLEAD